MAFQEYHHAHVSLLLGICIMMYDTYFAADATYFILANDRPCTYFLLLLCNKFNLFRSCELWIFSIRWARLLFHQRAKT